MIYNYKIAMNNKTFDDTEENFLFWFQDVTSRCYLTGQITLIDHI